MPYNSLVSRTDAAGLIPEEAGRDIIRNVVAESVVMRLGRRLPDLSRNQLRMPVVSALPSAYFVDGDTTLKQTTEVNWSDKYINVGELACIVPIPEAVLDDAAYDIWGEVRPLIAEAMGRAFDRAVLYGTNAPSTWPTDLLDGATAAGNAVTEGAAGNDLYDDIMGEEGTIAAVEEDGFLVSGHLAALSLRAKLRACRDDNQQPVFVRSMQEGVRYELDGEPLLFARNGAVDASQSLLVSGDWTQLVYALRQDITYKLLDEAVIQDTNGDIQYNLAQQDMVALRAVMRLGWQVPNPTNRIQSSESSRYPFAVLVPA